MGGAASFAINCNEPQHDAEALCHVLDLLQKLPMEPSDKTKRARGDLQKATLKEMGECLEKMKGGPHDVNLLSSKTFQISFNDFNE